MAAGDLTIMFAPHQMSSFSKMPIHVSDYIWHQSDEKVFLSLDLHQISPKNVDVVTTNSYLKVTSESARGAAVSSLAQVSFLPYIFEAFFCHAIDVDLSTARVAKGRIEFDLSKKVHEPWSDVSLKLTRDEMQVKRQEALNDVEEQEKQKEKERKEERNRRERFSVSRQISEDDRTREERAKMVEREKEEFLGQPSEEGAREEPSGVSSKSDPRRRMSSTCSEDGQTAAQEIDYDGDGEDSIYYSSTENLHRANGEVKSEKAENAVRKQRKSNAIRKAAQKDNKKKEDKKKAAPVPPVRQNGSIKVKYTPRVFPTPSRESTQEEEQQWLFSQSNASIATKECSSEGKEDYYKEKAVSLFGNGDYRGCVNACTEALKLNAGVPSFYSNRAAANLALSNLHHTISDCSKALELLTPANQDNGKSRLLCHIRRGTAFVRLGLSSEGLADYRAAIQLSPENKSLQKDVERIQAMTTSSADSGDSNDEDSGCSEEAVGS